LPVGIANASTRLIPVDLQKNAKMPNLQKTGAGSAMCASARINAIRPPILMHPEAISGCQRITSCARSPAGVFLFAKPAPPLSKKGKNMRHVEPEPEPLFQGRHGKSKPGTGILSLRLTQNF